MLKKTAIVIFIFMFCCSKAFGSEKALQEQIDQLRKHIHEMSSYYDSKIEALEKRLKMKELGRAGDMRPQHEDAHAHEEGHGEDQTGHHHQHGMLGDKVSVIGALDGRFVNIEGEKNTFMLHESKIGAQAQVTDWLFAYLTVVKHHGEDVHIEEAYAILDLDEWGFSAKPGKFFVNFGPENLAHFFDRRTITLSAMHEGMFGHEPWSDVGVQVEWKVPLEFYSKLSFGVINGNNGVSFGDGHDEVSNNNLPITANWTNAFDTDLGYLKVGNSFAWGQWDRDDKYNVCLVGTDAYYKLGNFDAQFELIYRWKEMPGIDKRNAYGYYFWGAYTIPFDHKYLKGIELLGGFGQFMPDTGERETRVTPQISLVFNNFAKLRATYEIREQYHKDRKDNRFITQFALAF